jgi:hypothetical protein
MQLRHAVLCFLFTLSPWILRGQTSAPPVAPAESVTSGNAAVTLSADQIKDLIRQAAQNDAENDKKQRNYTYLQRQEEHRLNGKGEPQSTETKTFEVMMLYSGQVLRLIEKDDKPLSEKDAAKEEQKIQKILDKRKNETEDQRKKRLAMEERSREEDRQFVREVTDAYNFRFAGIDDLEGRPTYVIDAEPRPGFEPQRKEAKYLPKFRFRVWIDKAESQWVKLDAECIDTVSFGWFVARIHKGSRLMIEQTRINDEAWLPKHMAVKVDVRLALLKNYNVEQDVTFRDYKKFHTDTKIVPLGEVQEH